MDQDTLKFLQKLTGANDPVATFVPLRAGVPGRPLLNQKLSKAWPTLAALNRTGNDIYFTVNTTDGLGRRAENVTEARAFWADYDHGVPTVWPLEPTLRVESSPGKAQCYWVLDAPMKPCPEWTALNKGIAVDSGADTNACDLARILRLPGFVNHKYPDKPMVKLLRPIGFVCTRYWVARSWTPVKQELIDSESESAAVGSMDEPEKRRRFAAWLSRAGAAPRPGSGLRSWLFRKAAAGVRDFALPAPAVAEMLLEVRELDEVDLPMLQRIARDAEHYGSKPKGSALVARRPGSITME